MVRIKICLTLALLFLVSIFTFAQEDDPELKKRIDKIDLLGFNYYEEGKYDSAEYYMLLTISLKETYYDDENSPEIAGTHINLASLYRYKLDYKNAIKHLDISEKMLKISDPESMYLAYIYHNKGNILFNYSDFGEAESYYQYAVELFERIGLINTSSFNTAILNYFNLLIVTNNKSSAESLIHIIESLDFNDDRLFNKHLFLCYAYQELGIFELELGRFKSGLEKLELSLSELQKTEETFPRSKKKQEDALRILSRAASIYLITDNYQKARESLYKSLDIVHYTSKYVIYRLIDIYDQLGTTYLQEKKYKKCFEVTTLALDDINRKSAKRLSNKTKKHNTIINSQLNTIYRLRAQAAFEIYLSTDNFEYLEISHENYIEAIDRLTLSRLNMKNEESVLFSTEITLDVYHEAIRVAVDLYNVSGDQSYLETAFNYTESSKSFALLSEIKGVEAMEFSDIPPDVKAEEERFKREITGYEELLYNEEASEAPDSTRMANFSDILFNLRDDYNSMLDNLENNYPKYFELKYHPHFASLDEIHKKISRNEALVEYVLSDTLLTTFIVDQDQISVLQHSIDASFTEDCIDYYQLLQSQDFDQNVHETYRNYVRLGREFYEILVAPVLEITEKKQITFVPDGVLMYLPFESFVTSDVDIEYVDYMSIPYLIHDLSVAYSYSSTLLFSKRFQTKTPEKKVLAFAPMYEDLMTETDPLRDGDSDFLIPLLGTKEEVDNIANRVPSEVFVDSMASEENFKKYASDYSIIHLAMHTIFDDENPMLSRLAFTRNENDSLEDNDLFTYEIYNIKLNAFMVVLSSCSSGYGEMQRGEGMMSLARGFMYAGCPSIVMTLWQVSDRSSSELMSSFYKYLKRGKTKKEALRLAKIDYILSADGLKSNPYFWSAFVMVGDSEPLYRKSASFYWITILAGFVAIILFFQYRGKIKRKLKR